MRVYALLLIGAGFAAAAVFAVQVGLDHNSEWGRGRVLLLAAGLILIAVAVALQSGRSPTWRVPGPVLSALSNSRVGRFLGEHRFGLLASVCVLLVLATYVFFISGGTWTSWPETTRYYDDLGSAFRAGRLDLDIKPPARLIALPDPYEPSVRNSDPALRAAVDKVWDLTFYKGKFYVYWGPAPGLLLAIAKLFYAGAVGDQVLTFLFLAGLLIFSALLILRLRDAFGWRLPALLVVTGILVSGLICPIPWMLNRAAIYEATIAGGQFFLIGGLYFAFTGSQGERFSYPRLALAVILWTFAASARTLMLIPAAFLTFMMVLWVVTNGRQGKPALRTLPGQLTLAAPLVLGILAIGWYNWARFGSVFETGLQYTLTFENLNRLYGQSFSAYYALPSLWMFLFDPFVVQQKFPFLVAVFGRAPGLLYLRQVGLYHAEEITGLLFSAPFAVFAAPSIWTAAQGLWRRDGKPSGSSADSCEPLIRWTVLSLGGSVLLTLGAIALYFNITMRFLAEFMPSLALLAVLGTWCGYRYVEQHLRWTNLYVAIVVLLGLATILISLLLALSESHGAVQQYSPHLMKELMRFFGGQ